MARRLRHVLHVATECAPLAKAGGLADVVAALPRRLLHDAPDVEVSVVIPWYGGVDGHGAWRACSGSVAIGEDSLRYRTCRAGSDIADFPVYLVDQEVFRPRDLYTSDGELERNAVLSHAAVTLAQASRRDEIPGVPPIDVVHAHDYHAALACVWLRHAPPGDRIPTVFTVHNAHYQGVRTWGAVERLPLPSGLAHGDSDYDRSFNSLKAGLLAADIATTVSPTHARELRESATASLGLDYVFNALGSRFEGVLNGIDVETWDPARDPHLDATYDVDHLAGKQRVKAAVCREHGLEASRPLLVFIGRLVSEKGIDVLLQGMRLLREREPDVQLLVLGAGSPEYAAALAALEAAAPDRVRAALRQDEALAHRLYAAADILLMPSWYEPCGLSQMYAMRYGTVPVVYPTGGLRDTVVPFDAATGQGTGAWMETHHAAALVASVARALEWWRNPAIWRILQHNGMATDSSWGPAATRYLELYRQASEVST